MENTSINNEVSTETTNVTEVVDTPEVQEKPAEETYTRKQMDTEIARAVNSAVAKAKAKEAKSAEDRISDLERQLAERDNREYVTRACSESSIPIELAPLFYSDNEQTSQDKITLLSTYLQSMIDIGIDNKLKEAQPISLRSSDPITKDTQKHLKSLADRQKDYEITHGKRA